MAPLSAIGLARSVEPVMVRRRCMIVWMLSSAFAPETVADTIRFAAAEGLVGGSIEDASGDERAPIYEFGHAVWDASKPTENISQVGRLHILMPFSRNPYSTFCWMLSQEPERGRNGCAAWWSSRRYGNNIAFSRSMPGCLGADK